jgi:hypothetical protein
MQDITTPTRDSALIRPHPLFVYFFGTVLIGGLCSTTRYIGPGRNRIPIEFTSSLPNVTSLSRNLDCS